MTTLFWKYIFKNKQIAYYICLFFFSAITLSWGKEFELPSAAGLDPSWHEALVQATDQHLAFGKEIIFTFGPFHQIYTNQISENLGPFLIGRLLYGVALGSTLVALARFSSLSLGWATAAFMALSTSNSTDATFYTIPLIFLLASSIKSRERLDTILLAFIYMGLILGILTKLSYAIASIPTVIVSTMLLTRQNKQNTQVILLILCVGLVTPIFLWLVSKQSLLDFPQYLLGANIELIKGYSSAMSYNDTTTAWQTYAYWIGAAIILIIIAKTAYLKTTSLKWTTYIAVNTLIITWVTFKAGMVRHDGHAVISGLSLASFAIIAYAYALKELTGNNKISVLAVPLMIGLSITSQFINPVRSKLDQWANELQKNTTIFAKAIILKSQRLTIIKLRQSSAIAKSPEFEDLSQIPKNSTADAFPWDVRDLSANGLRYSPRPTIQSYAAYTDSLQRINSQHLKSYSSPTYIVLKAFSFDFGMPMELDAESFRIITSNYKLVGHGNRGSLILKKLPEQLRNHEERWNSLKTPLRSGISNGNKNWSELPARLLPGSRISIIIKPSTLRRLQTILFKSPPLYVEIEFTNKQIQSYKISESTSKHITIYPFVTDNQSLENAFNVIQSTVKKNIALGPKPVKIRLTGSKEILGINSADLIIEQPLPR